MLISVKCPICDKKLNLKPSVAKKFITCSHKCFYKTGRHGPNWKGGRYTSNDGYILVYSPNHPRATKDKYVCEHRLVMEKYIGRILEKTEVVHHINGKRSDNRIANLRLLKSQSVHVREHLIPGLPKFRRQNH